MATLGRGMAVVLILIGVVGGGAWLFTDPTRTAPLDAHLRRGDGPGAASLQAELRAAHPPGSPLSPLLAGLQRQGFVCRPQPETAGAWACIAQLPRPPGRLTRVEVSLSAIAERLGTISVAINEAAAPGRP
jgi:hypothetical protein